MAQVESIKIHCFESSCTCSGDVKQGVAEARGPTKLKVMTDYCAFTIRDNEFSTDYMDLLLLPLALGLIVDLQRWLDFCNSILNWEDPHERCWIAEREQAFNKEGRALTECL